MPQHLDRDVAMMLEVVGEIHGGHAAGAELAFNAIAVSERVAQSREVSHVSRRAFPGRHVDLSRDVCPDSEQQDESASTRWGNAERRRYASQRVAAS